MSTQLGKELKKAQNLVLVVEDDHELLGMLLEWLEVEGIPALGTDCVIEAKAILRGYHVGVTLLDWSLGGANTQSNGRHLLLHTRENFPLVATIVMTGKDAIDVETESLGLRADGFIKKPMNSTKLIGSVKRWRQRLERSMNFSLPGREQDIIPLKDIEKIYIQHVVKLLGNNMSLAADRLGLHRQTVASIMAKES